MLEHNSLYTATLGSTEYITGQAANWLCTDCHLHPQASFRPNGIGLGEKGSG